MATVSLNDIKSKKKTLSLNEVRSRANTRPATKAPEPQQSVLGKVGSALIQSEKRFGQSVGDAIFAPTAVKRLTESSDKTTKMQMKVLERIRQKRARGEDTARLEKTLRENAPENIVKQLEQITPSVTKSAKQVFGEGLGVATDIASVGALPGVGKALFKTGAKTVAGGVARGAVKGAIPGAIFGGAQGGTRAAQEDKSTKEILKDTATGAGVGAAIGGVLGGVSGGVAGAKNKAKLKEIDFREQLVMQKPTDKVRQAAIKEGRITDSKIFKKSGITPSKRDKDLAEAVKGLVSRKKTLKGNVDSIKGEVARINKGVGEYITRNKVPFNTKQLKTKLVKAKADNRLIFASDTTAERTYDAVVEEFMEQVGKKDTKGLFQARQSFDRIPAIKKLLQTEGLGENTRRQIVLDVRRAANEYISDQLPKGNQYKPDLLKETRILESLGNIAAKSSKDLGKSKIQLILQEYPIIKWWTSALVGAGGVGVGASILLSGD